jgi:hypothetical protein
VLKKKYFQVFFKKHYKNTKAWKLAFVSSTFKYFLKSSKKRKIRVCLKNLRVCHYYVYGLIYMKKIHLNMDSNHKKMYEKSQDNFSLKKKRSQISILSTSNYLVLDKQRYVNVAIAWKTLGFLHSSYSFQMWQGVSNKLHVWLHQNPPKFTNFHYLSMS